VNASPQPLDTVIAALWERLAPEQRATAERLLVAVADVDGPHGDGAWQEVRELAHRLAGSLGSLGQREAGAIAVELEERTAGVAWPPAAEVVAEVHVRAAALCEALTTERPASGATPSDPRRPA
jgi:HPt (histidine-containing phosphotransfer) domain-containing protein